KCKNKIPSHKGNIYMRRGKCYYFSENPVAFNDFVVSSILIPSVGSPSKEKPGILSASSKSNVLKSIVVVSTTLSSLKSSSYVTPLISLNSSREGSSSAFASSSSANSRYSYVNSLFIFCDAT